MRWPNVNTILVQNVVFAGVHNAGLMLVDSLRCCPTIKATFCWSCRIQQTPYVNPMVVQCWPNVCNHGPTLYQHWVNVSCLLDIYHAGLAGYPILLKCWSTVCDAGPTLKQHLLIVSYLPCWLCWFLWRRMWLPPVGCQWSRVLRGTRGWGWHCGDDHWMCDRGVTGWADTVIIVTVTVTSLPITSHTVSQTNIGYQDHVRITASAAEMMSRDVTSHGNVCRMLLEAKWGYRRCVFRVVEGTTWCESQGFAILQRQKAVTAYFTSDQLQPFCLCRYCKRCVGFAGENPMPILLSSVVFVLSLLVVRTRPANDRMSMPFKAKSFFLKAV